jgi:hypothetical protein
MLLVHFIFGSKLDFLHNQSKSLIGVWVVPGGNPRALLTHRGKPFEGHVKFSGSYWSMPWLKVMKGCENVLMLRDGGGGDSSDIGG